MMGGSWRAARSISRSTLIGFGVPGSAPADVLLRVFDVSDPTSPRIVDRLDLELVRQMVLDCAPSTRLESPRALVGTDFSDRLADIDLAAARPAGRMTFVPPMLATTAPID